MATPKSTLQGVAGGAFAQLSVDIASIAANTTLDVQVTAPRNFKIGRPVLVLLGPAETALNIGVQVNGVGRCLMVSTTKKIEFRVSNHTAGAIDPTARVFYFLQL